MFKSASKKKKNYQPFPVWLSFLLLTMVVVLLFATATVLPKFFTDVKFFRAGLFGY